MDNSDRLYDKVIDTVQDCIFWKDKDRRFVGVNQAFLDFYGFESADVLIGKTDEDMGWHSDPEPFRQDELRVLAGESVYKAHGKCIIRGRERDIIASKSPIYDGDEIVGLIGSFVDVTDVLKRDENLRVTRKLYTREQLECYPYFDRILSDTGLEEILDSLTGVISRGYILDFARTLIEDGTPFTFAMVDLDNFKFINDTYGHQAGDEVLMKVADELVAFNGEVGLVGRFGGDELMMINFKYIDYDSKKQFFEQMYVVDGIFRKNFKLGNCRPFITATIGAATYPDDASDYEGLFELLDKTLYRGKSKGRNCYIIYVEAKHKNLEIKKLAGHGIYTSMHSLAMTFEQAGGLVNKLEAVMPMLRDELQISDIYYAGESGIMHGVLDTMLNKDISDIKKLILEDIYSDGMEKLEGRCPKLYAALKELGVETVLIVKVSIDKKKCGYLMFGAPRKQRIWQENEFAIAYFLAKLMAAHVYMSGEQIP